MVEKKCSINFVWYFYAYFANIVRLSLFEKETQQGDKFFKILNWKFFSLDMNLQITNNQYPKESFYC